MSVAVVVDPGRAGRPSPPMAPVRNFSLDSPFTCRPVMPASAVTPVKMSTLAETCRYAKAIRMPSAARTATGQRIIWAAAPKEFPGRRRQFLPPSIPLASAWLLEVSALSQQIQHCLEFAARVHVAGLRADLYTAAVDLAGFIALAEFLKRLTAVIVSRHELWVDLKRLVEFPHCLGVSLARASRHGHPCPCKTS